MTDARFPRAARLRKRREFDSVFAASSSSGNRYFRVLGRPNGLDIARLGLAISRKVDKRATVRNRIKRLVRESFREHRESLAGWDFVVLSNRNAAEADRPALSEAIDELWPRFAERTARSRGD